MNNRGRRTEAQQGAEREPGPSVFTLSPRVRVGVNRFQATGPDVACYHDLIHLGLRHICTIVGFPSAVTYNPSSKPFSSALQSDGRHLRPKGATDESAISYCYPPGVNDYRDYVEQFSHCP